MTVTLRPLSNAIGAEIGGVDLTEALSDTDKAAVNAAFLEHHVLCVPGEALAPKDFRRFAEIFGEVQPQLYRNRFHPDEPLVSVLKSVLTAEQAADPASVRVAGWHSDDSYFERPCKATMLQAIELPPKGGATRFCNLRAAYDALDDATKARLEGLTALHCYDTPRAAARAKARTEIETEETAKPARHALVRTIPETGKKTLYLNYNRMDRIPELTRAESDALLDQLYGHIDQPRFHYHHAWRRGDILMWDNRCTMHAAVPDYEPGAMRLHHRILLRGDAVAA
jgi:taurine dioxygenase